MPKKQNAIKIFYDVVIIGAGPAGATAASELVKQGYKVLIIERKKLPRYKICSGLIIDRAQDLLEEHFGTPPDHVFCKPKFLKGARLCLEKDSLIDVPVEKAQTYNIWRAKFDQWLIQKSGAEVLDKHLLVDLKQTDEAVQVYIQTPNDQIISIKASFVIGADGGRSSVRLLLDSSFGKKVKQFTFAQAYCDGSIDLDPKYFYMFFDPSLSAFYTWLNFKDDYLIYGAAVHKGEKLTPAFNDSTNYLQKTFGLGIKKVIKKTGCTGTDMGITGKFFLGLGRVLLAGEAAGFMNIFGEGISSAIATGHLAATAIIQAQTANQEVLPIYKEISKTEEEITRKSWDIANMILGRAFLPN